MELCKMEFYIEYDIPLFEKSAIYLLEKLQDTIQKTSDLSSFSSSLLSIPFSGTELTVLPPSCLPLWRNEDQHDRQPERGCILPAQPLIEKQLPTNFMTGGIAVLTLNLCLKNLLPGFSSHLPIKMWFKEIHTTSPKYDLLSEWFHKGVPQDLNLLLLSVCYLARPSSYPWIIMNICETWKGM